MKSTLLLLLAPIAALAAPAELSERQAADSINTLIQAKGKKYYGSCADQVSTTGYPFCPLLAYPGGISGLIQTFLLLPLLQTPESPDISFDKREVLTPSVNRADCRRASQRPSSRPTSDK